MDFKGPYHSIRMRLGNALVVCDLYGLSMHSGHFLVGEAFLSYFGCNECNDLIKMDVMI